MLRTRITELFDIDHPILSGGMQWVSRAELVAAVAEAGAIGFMTALSHDTPEKMAEEVRRARELTDRSIGVNLTILPTLKPVPYDEYARAIAESGVKYVETAGRNPEALLPIFKQAGIKVIHKCTSVRHALKAQSIGCDAVTIDGFECAGHPGEDDLPGLILIPSAVDALTVPVVACGGFSDGRGLAAALALGAEGIAMGSRFLATREAPVHDNVKQKMVESGARDTALIFRTLRNTARVYKNSVTEKVLELEARGAGIEELAPLVSGKRGRELLQTGDMEDGIWSAGPVIERITDVPTVAELVARITDQAETILKAQVARIA
jgi:nitronate monooxygenase